MSSNEFKIQKSAENIKGSGFKKYKYLVLGESSFIFLLKYELIVLLCSQMPGALGLFLRTKLYPFLIGRVGKGVIFGKNVTLRHPRKINIGDNVIIDDGCVLDAKGMDNKGITIENGVYVGRNTIVYCKNGEIVLQEKVNIGHNSMIFSSNKVLIEKETLIAGYSYIMSGGNYDYKSSEKIIDQSGYSKGHTIIGSNCWIGAKAVIADGVSIGKESVIGAGSVVLENVLENKIAVGVPAKTVKSVK